MNSSTFIRLFPEEKESLNLGLKLVIQIPPSWLPVYGSNTKSNISVITTSVIC